MFASSASGLKWILKSYYSLLLTDASRTPRAACWNSDCSSWTEVRADSIGCDKNKLILRFPSRRRNQTCHLLIIVSWKRLVEHFFRFSFVDPLSKWDYIGEHCLCSSLIFGLTANVFLSFIKTEHRLPSYTSQSSRLFLSMFGKTKSWESFIIPVAGLNIADLMTYSLFPRLSLLRTRNLILVFIPGQAFIKGKIEQVLLGNLSLCKKRLKLEV